MIGHGKRRGPSPKVNMLPPRISAVDDPVCLIVGSILPKQVIARLCLNGALSVLIHKTRISSIRLDLDGSPFGPAVYGIWHKQEHPQRFSCGCFCIWLREGDLDSHELFLG